MPEKHILFTCGASLLIFLQHIAPVNCFICLVSAAGNGSDKPNFPHVVPGHSYTHPGAQVTTAWLICRTLAIVVANRWGGDARGPASPYGTNPTSFLTIPLEPILRKMCRQPICHVSPSTTWCTTLLVMPARRYVSGDGAHV